MELYLYCLLAVICLLLSLSRTDAEKRSLDIGLFFLLCLLSLVVRQYLQVDMGTYARAMDYKLGDMFKEIYFLRNIVFWGINSFLFHLGVSPRLIFFLWDAVSFITILEVRRRLSLPYYFVPLFYVSFLGVFGLQNIYRQYLASVFLLYSFSIISESRGKSFLFFLISALIHESSFLLLGVLFILLPKKAMRNSFFSLFLVVVIMGTLFVVMNTEDDLSRATGQDMSKAYLLVFILISFAALLTISWQGRKAEASSVNRKLQITLYALTINITAYMVMGGSLYYERISILLLPVMLIVLIDALCCYKQRRILSLTFSTILMAPTFIFESTRLFLLNDPTSISY